MALAIKDLNLSVITSGGGEQVLTTQSALEDPVAYVFQIEAAALAGAEEFTLRIFGPVDIDGTPTVKLYEATFTKGSGADALTTPPIPLQPNGTADFSVTIEPSGWGADRTLNWVLFRL